MITLRNNKNMKSKKLFLSKQDVIDARVSLEAATEQEFKKIELSKKGINMEETKGCDHCKDPNGECCYPHYGMAPHTHDMSKTGSIIGSTVIDPKEKWLNNFCEDPEAPGCGVYAHCPKCGWDGQ